MSTPAVERRLADLLAERAEDAMSRTNTQDRLASLLANTDQGHPARRRGLVAAGLVAAGAATIVTVMVATGDDDTVGPASGTAVEPVSRATAFLEAAYGGPPGEAEGMVSPDLELTGAAVAAGQETRADWERELAWTRVLDYELVDVACQPGPATAAGSVVTCEYALHGTGSKQLGLGPYGGNTMRLTITDGLITQIDETLNYIDNGFSDELWVPFANWVRQEHPADVARMYTSADQSLPRLDAVSLGLWDERVDEYVAETGG